ncbi:MAG: gliding motility-associated C-terminal domain-containing protein, partial [Crocinitomicaceae bacterium]
AEIYDATFSISLNISGDSTICFGDSLTVSTNPSLMGYQWNMNDNGSYFIFASQEGTYTVTGTNEYGCTAQSDSLTLHINTGSKTPTFTSQTICQGDEAIFIYTDTNNVYWYSDSLGTQLISISDTFTISQLQNDTTIYLIQYAGNCQSTIIASTVHVSSISNGISITGDSTICNNASIDLASAFVGVSSWTGPNNYSSSQDSIIINNVSSINEGWYFVNITDGACHKTDSIWVNVSQPLNNHLDTSGTITICNGSQVTISALDTNYQIYWLPNGETAQNITVSNEGEYYVSLTDSNGCNALSDTITIAFFQNAAPLLSDTSVCFGNSFTFIDTSSYNLNWYDLDTNFIGTENLTLSNLISDTSFYYQYLDTVTGCNASLNIYTIHVLPSSAPYILGDSIICANTEHNYLVSYQSDGTSIWSVNGNPYSSQDSINIYLEMDTSFYLVLTTTGSLCSNGVDSIFIQNILPPRPILGDSITTICNNFAFNWVTNNNGYDALWSTDLGYTTNGDTLYMHYNQNINSYGNVIFIDSNGCQSTANYFSAIPAIAAVYSLVQASTTCVGDTIIAIGFANGAMDSYWITPNGNLNNDTLFLNGIDASNSGNYIFVVEDSSTCISKDTFNLQVGTPPQFSLGMDTILCNGSSLIISSPQSTSFIWSNGSTDASQEINTSVDLVLTIWSGTYCPSTDTISIQFIDCEAEAANVITSNGDGINDVLYIKDSEYMPDDYIVITTRWGDIVYEAHDYKNDFNPAVTNVSDGVYFYVYYRTWNPKDPHPLTGFFHIIH